MQQEEKVACATRDDPKSDSNVSEDLKAPVVRRHATCAACVTCAACATCAISATYAIYAIRAICATCVICVAYATCAICATCVTCAICAGAVAMTSESAIWWGQAFHHHSAS